MPNLESKLYFSLSGMPIYLSRQSTVNVPLIRQFPSFEIFGHAASNDKSRDYN